GMVAGPSRAQASARAAERDPARGGSLGVTHEPGRHRAPRELPAELIHVTGTGRANGSGEHMEAPPAPMQADACARFDGNCALPGRHFSHVSSLCQRNGPQIRVFATFCVSNGTLKQLVDEKVLPFLLARARWALGPSNAREFLVHVLDPSAFTYEGYADLTAEQIIKRALGGGRFREAATHWSPRITPLLAVLSPNCDVTLKFDPGPTCDLARRACAGMWHYDQSRGGSVERTRPRRTSGSLPTLATRCATRSAKCSRRGGRSGCGAVTPRKRLAC